MNGVALLYTITPFPSNRLSLSTLCTVSGSDSPALDAATRVWCVDAAARSHATTQPIDRRRVDIAAAARRVQRLDAPGRGAALRKESLRDVPAGLKDCTWHSPSGEKMRALIIWAPLPPAKAFRHIYLLLCRRASVRAGDASRVRAAGASFARRASGGIARFAVRVSAHLSGVCAR